MKKPAEIRSKRAIPQQGVCNGKVPFAMFAGFQMMPYL